MSRIWRDVRLIPIVLLATASLFALKVSGLVFDGGYTLAERMQGRDKSDLKVTTGESVPDFPKIVDERGAPIRRHRRWPRQQRRKSPGRRKCSISTRRRATTSPARSAARTEEEQPAPRASDQHQAARCDQAGNRRRHLSDRGRPHQFAGRARGARTPAGPPARARFAQPRARHAREPDQGGGEAAGGQGRRAEGPRIARQYRGRHARQGGGGALQGHRRHVREHEAEGCRAHLRSARA